MPPWSQRMVTYHLKTFLSNLGENPSLYNLGETTNSLSGRAHGHSHELKKSYLKLFSKQLFSSKLAGNAQQWQSWNALLGIIYQPWWASACVEGPPLLPEPASAAVPAWPGPNPLELLVKPMALPLPARSAVAQSPLSCGCQDGCVSHRWYTEYSLVSCRKNEHFWFLKIKIQYS